MALWTFRATIVPTEALGDCRHLSEAQFEELFEHFWDKRDGEEAAKELLSLLLPLRPWDSRLTLVGHEGGDRIEVWREHGRVTGVTLKVDCRTPNLSFVDSVEALAAKHRLLLIYARTFEVCEPKAGALRRFVMSSASRRALEDLKTWVPHLAAEVKKREENS
jgi:hypothetical protein